MIILDAKDIQKIIAEKYNVSINDIIIQNENRICYETMEIEEKIPCLNVYILSEKDKIYFNLEN